MTTDTWEFYRGFAAATGLAVLTGIGWHMWAGYRATRAAARRQRDALARRAAATRASLDSYVDRHGRRHDTRPYDWNTDRETAS